MKVNGALYLIVFVAYTLVFSSCNRGDLLPLSENSIVRLSDVVRIARTSESTFGLIDQDGLSLVYGNLEKASLDKTNEKVSIEYREYISRREKSEGKVSKTMWAEVDLRNQKVTVLNRCPDGLLPIREFYKKMEIEKK